MQEHNTIIGKILAGINRKLFKRAKFRTSTTRGARAAVSTDDSQTNDRLEREVISRERNSGRVSDSETRGARGIVNSGRQPM